MSFTAVDPSVTKIDFVNRVDEEAFRNSMFFDYFLNGGGVAIGDINNDGLADVFFTGNDADNQLYLNQGDLVFENISKRALPSVAGWSTGVNMIDIYNDGFLDIFVC